MVDVSAKNETVREALASGDLSMAPATAKMIRAGTAKKGDVLAVARLAAIQATKLTQQLIPLCHAIPIEAVTVDFRWGDQSENAAAVLRCTVRVRTTAKTGVEMEAMTGAAVGALALYDMVKGIDRSAEVTSVRLLTKSGGASGEWIRG